MAAIPPNNNLEGLIASLKDGIYGAYNKGVKYGRYLALQEYLERKESAQPKWVSVIDNPPDEGDIIFVHDPDEGWIALVKVIRVNLASIDAIGIYPGYSVPFNAKVWMPLKFPKVPEEEK